MSFADAELMDIARRSVRGLRLQEADADDAAQEAAVGIYRKLGNLDISRSEDQQRGYLWRVGRSKAIRFLAWRSLRREVPYSYIPGALDDGGRPTACSGLDLAQARQERHQGRAAVTSPEDELAVLGLDAAIACVALTAARGDEEDAALAEEALRAGLTRLSTQEAALFRYKLGAEPMREDLVKLGKGPRGSVSNRARRKLLTAAEEAGCADVITPELLLRVFGPRED